MAIKSFGAFLTEDALLLLEYDENLTWKQHGQKILDHIEKTNDPHPIVRDTKGDLRGGKNRADFDELHKQTIMDHLAHHDPTPNKKYTQHIARIYGAGGINRMEDLGRMKSALSKFDDLSRRKIIPPEHRDIGRVKSLGQLEDIVDAHSDTMSGKEQDRAHHEEMKKQATITKYPTFTHIIPHTEAASNHFGKGTRWCTTSDGAVDNGFEHGDTLFSHYSKQGPLHILVPHEPRFDKREKYQFHYSSGQFMNDRDEPIDSQTMYKHHNNQHDSYMGYADVQAPKEIEKWVDDYNNSAAQASKSRETAFAHSDSKVARDFIRNTDDTQSIHDYIKRPNTNVNDIYDLTTYNKNLKSEHLDTMLDHRDSGVRGFAARSPKITKDQWERAVNDKDPDVRAGAWERGDSNQYHSDYMTGEIHATPEHIDRALDDKNPTVRNRAAGNIKASAENIHKALNDKDFYVRRNATSNPNVDASHISKALDDDSEDVASTAIKSNITKLNNDHIERSIERGGSVAKSLLDHSTLSKHLTDKHLQRLIDSHPSHTGLMMTAAHHPAITHQQLHQLLDNKDPFIRASVVDSNNADSTHLDRAVRDDADHVRNAAAQSNNIEPRHVDTLMNHLKHYATHSNLVSPYYKADRFLKPEHLKKILSTGSLTAKEGAALHQNHDEESYQMALNDEHSGVRDFALRSEYTRPEHALHALGDVNPDVRMTAAAKLKTDEDIEKGLSHPTHRGRAATYWYHRDQVYNRASYLQQPPKSLIDSLDRVHDELHERGKKLESRVRELQDQGHSSSQIHQRLATEFPENRVMKFREFIAESQLLLEYDRDITIKQHGDKALKIALGRDEPHDSYLNDVQGLHSGHVTDRHPGSNEDKAKNELFSQFEEADPTPNKKYVQHIARIYGNGGVNRHEDLFTRMKSGLEKFHDLATRKVLPPEHRDIGRVKSLEHLEDLVDEHGEKESGREKDAAHHERMKGEATITDHPTFTQIIPHTPAAANHFGKGTRWCTTGGHGAQMFNHYNKSGPLQILIPKKPSYPGEKYQFHYATGQFMNEKDRAAAPIDRHNSDLRDTLPETNRDISNHVQEYEYQAREASRDRSGLTHPEPKVAKAALKNAPNITRQDLSTAMRGGAAKMALENPMVDKSHVKLALDHQDPEVRVKALEKHPDKVDMVDLFTALKKDSRTASAALKNPGITKDHLDIALNHNDAGVKVQALGHPKATSKMVDDAMSHPKEKTRALIARNAEGTHIIDKALQDKSPLVRWAAINNNAVQPHHFDQAINDPHPEVRLGVVSHPDTTRHALDKGAFDDDPIVRAAAKSHKRAVYRGEHAFIEPKYPARVTKASENRGDHHAYTHVPGNELSDNTLTAVKRWASNHNKTSDQKVRVRKIGRAGIGNPHSKTPEGKRAMRNGNVAQAHASRNDIYISKLYNPDNPRRNNDKLKHPLFEELLDELSSELIHKYVDKAKRSVDRMKDEPYTNDKDSKVFKRKMFISFAQHARLKEEQLDEEKIRHPEDKKAYVEPHKNDGETVYKASNKHGHVKFFNSHGRESAFKHAGLSTAPKKVDEETQIDELSAATLLNYKDKAYKSQIHHEIRACDYDERAAENGDRIHDDTPLRRRMNYHDNKGIQRQKGQDLAREKLRKKNVIPVKFREFVEDEEELVERTLRSPTYLAAVRWRRTKMPDVRHHKGKKMKGLVRTNKTQYVTRLLYKNRNKHETHHLTTRSKHQLTDRWRDQRLVRVNLLKKNKNIHGNHFHESKEYLKNRELLHSAHAQAGREMGKRERDPELKRIHLLRSRNHQHAAKVLEILRSKRKK